MPQARSAKPKPKPKPPLARSGSDADATGRLSDVQIATEATRRLAWDAAVPDHSVKVTVTAGRITLRGELRRDQQRIAALEDITRLFGVTGVTDHTVVKAPK